MADLNLKELPKGKILAEIEARKNNGGSEKFAGFSTTQLSAEVIHRQKLAALLEDIHPDVLAEILLNKAGLIKDDGLLRELPYALRITLGPISCIDSFGFRETPNGREVLAIVRNTDEFAGLTCAIGGGTAYGESLEDSLKRHWRNDLGCEIEFDWEYPLRMNQFKPGGTGQFNPDAKKHSIAPAYSVKLLNEPTKLGNTIYGQEARGYTWFNKDNFPAPEKFAYGFYKTFHQILFGK